MLKGSTASLQPQGTPKTQRVTALGAGVAAGRGVPVSLVCPGFVTAGDGWAGAGHGVLAQLPSINFLLVIWGKKKKEEENRQ